MRKIEENMIAAVAMRRDWSSGNTSVRVNHKNEVEVRLHGNLICRITKGKRVFSSCGWATSTTRSRLNALGCDCHIVKGSLRSCSTGELINTKSI